MELLRPADPRLPPSAADCLCSVSSSLDFRPGFDPMVSPWPLDTLEEGGFNGDVVFVAVGKSLNKALGLLQWTFSRFVDKEICLLHVHQPSPLIPTLLGKLPASQANGDVVAAYRKEEWLEMRKLLDNYVGICSRAKVKARIVTIESDQVPKGIVDLANKYDIRKLVMGTVRSTPDNIMKVKVRKNSTKADYAAQNIPLPCEIWFINKGRLVWTREAVEEPCNSMLWTVPEENSGSSSFRPGDYTSFYRDFQLPSSSKSAAMNENFIETSGSTNSFSGFECLGSSDSESKAVGENSNSQLRKAFTETEISRKEVIAEFLKCKRMELVAMEAMKKVKIFETAHESEVRLREEAEDALSSAIQEQEKFLEEREEIEMEIQRTMRSVALLDSRAQELNRRQDEASGEVELIQSSLVALRQEKHKIQQQKAEAINWLERWRTKQAGSANWRGFIGFFEEFPQLAEFSLSELEFATCNFSESFKIGQHGYGSVYKGELMGRTVAIRKLYPHNVQGPSEFQQEVQVLGNLHHPHLVTLLGICTEAWSLVYEYLPNGSLQRYLCRKGNTPPLTWKSKVKVIAEISSALCFMHSAKPEKIIHGDLKPDNILLDSQLSCKICDFGICRLVSEETLNCPSFRQSTEPKGTFSYTDPEFQRSGVLTTKSDVYSFGLIILQLLTGKPTVGLVVEARKAMSSGKIESILDLSGGEWPSAVARRLVDIGLRCCDMKGRDRPEITPAFVRELNQLYASEERVIPSYYLCPILQEVMHDPQVAADGFTYEGEAIKGWLDNGRKTSPMTNLELSHSYLTPNHALRVAIQEWLCKSLTTH